MLSLKIGSSGVSAVVLAKLGTTVVGNTLIADEINPCAATVPFSLLAGSYQLAITDSSIS
jgi:hypothetical protein